MATMAFNAGTRRLGEGKLREAEAFFQSALTRQDEHFQPQTLHNLGHVRYEQGAEELKKSPDAKAASQRASNALDRGDACKQIEKVNYGKIISCCPVADLSRCWIRPAA